jgi:tetratricopeptide (TPR) repeat protein
LNADFDSWMEQALAASHRDDVEAALAAFRSAAAADPGSALPHFLMGAEYAQAQRLAEAEAAFANAVLLAPDFETARYQLGLLQFTSGRAAVAHVTWEPLFRLPETHPLRSFVLGFAALARDEFDAALSHFQAGIDLNQVNLPMNNDIRQVIAAIERLRGREQPGIAQAEPVAEHVLLAAYRQGAVH